MRIAITTVGSLGDVQPYVALGKGLQHAGHHVTVVTHWRFREFIMRHGLGFAPLAGDPKDMLLTPEGQRWLMTGRNGFLFAKGMADFMRPLMADGTRDCMSAFRNADAVIFSFLAWFSAHGILEKTGLPSAAAYLQPFAPTGEFPPIGSPNPVIMKRLINRFFYWAGERIVWRWFRPAANSARAEILDLPPLTRSMPFEALRLDHTPAVYGYSRHVIARPMDWPDHIEVTGYWFLDEEPEPEIQRRLTDFIDRGTRPIYVGFGSMGGWDPEGMTEIVMEALKISGKRAILQTGWGGLSSNIDSHDVAVVESVPHSWLFGKMAAVVHHSGAGTTAAGFRAGVPSVPVPFFGDQYFWATTAHKLGVATKPIGRDKLTARKLAENIIEATNSEAMQARARELGNKIRKEDGIGSAVRFLEAQLGKK